MLTPILLLVMACNPPTGTPGQVTDYWNAPIEGAIILVEGQGQRYTSDADGGFELPASLQGAQTLKVGAKGHIHEYVEVDLAGDARLPPISLYPKPADNGFHVVGADGFVDLQPVRVERMGNELRSLVGMRQDPDVPLDGSGVHIVFHSDLRYSEVMQLGLSLHKLAYVRETELPGPLGNAPVTVNMWTSAGEVPMTLEPMRSRSDYMIVAEELEPGAYAFQMKGLLDAPDAESFDALPPQMRVAFPFDIR